MAWRGLFDTYFFYTVNGEARLWHWSTWSAAIESLDSLVSAARDKASIRSTQYLQAEPSESIRFGRIGWNKKGHMKWTHASPVNRAESEDWRFFNAEAWAPSWTIYEREANAPDVYIHTMNATFSSERSSCFVVLALRHEFVLQLPDTVNTTVSQLSELLSPDIVGYKRRSWRSTGGANGYRKHIQDLTVDDLVVGDAESGFVRRYDDWKPISPNAATADNVDTAN